MINSTDSIQKKHELIVKLLKELIFQTMRTIGLIIHLNMENLFGLGF
jgi:hypothetical protein